MILNQDKSTISFANHGLRAYTEARTIVQGTPWQAIDGKTLITGYQSVLPQLPKFNF